MGVERFFNKTLTQNRKASGTGDKVEDWVLVATFRGCLYPIGMSDPAIFSSDYLRLKITHKMHCATTESIKSGDQIEDGTKKYIVKRAPNWVTFYDTLLSEGG